MSAAPARKLKSGGRPMLGLLLCAAALLTAPSPEVMRVVETTTLAAWTWTRDGTVDLISRGRARLQQVRLQQNGPPAVALASNDDVLLSGDHDPVDERTRDLSGVVTFLNAEMRLERGGALKTRPDRLVSSEAPALDGLTWAAAFEIPAGVQVEIRAVTTGAAPSLCAGAEITRLALVQTQRTVAILPIRAGAPETFCPVLHLEKRR